MSIPEEVAKLVSESGNNFHARVARWLQANEWHVSVSPYYMDQSQNKAREIDLIAEKLWPIHDRWGQNVGDVAVRLFIECKFIPSYSVFWFVNKDINAAKRLVCTSGPFRPENTYTEKHHYLAHSHNVAKLFATSVGRIPDNDPYYRALNQVLNAMVSMRGQQVSIPTGMNRSGDPKVLLEFPVVVCSSFKQMYEVDFFTDSEPQIVMDNFQLEIQYAYYDRAGTQRAEYLLLDFVEFDLLRRFIDCIEEDAKAAVICASPTLG